MTARCLLCPGKYHCVQPSGPQNCNDYRFIGEAPGKEENAKGIPFIGKTGREVNEHYLPIAGLRRDDENVTFDNAIRCLPDTSGHKLDIGDSRHLELLDSCAEAHLRPTLRRTKPRVIVPMGAFACWAIDRDIKLDLHHGIPLETEYGTVFPMWHPAGGIHEPKKMLQIRTDWYRFGQFIKYKLKVPVDPYPNPDYRVATLKDVRDIDPSLPMGNDTEYSKSIGPYCYTYSQYPGTGRLIMYDRPELLRALQEKLNQMERGAWLYWHNWLYDQNNTEGLGLSLPLHLIRDTMLMVFHLGHINQGLKSICYRELGMEMQDYDDLVGPYSRQIAIDYFELARMREWDKPPKQSRVQGDGSMKDYQPQSLSTKLKRFFTDLAKAPDTKDVFKTWDNWEASQLDIEAAIGPWPGRDIAHVPFDEMLPYACRDADGCLRAVPVIKEMRRHVRRKPQEQWGSSNIRARTTALMAGVR